MPRMIIAEGPDGAGKSTLVERLEKDLGRRVIHSGGPPANIAEWRSKIALVVANQRSPVIFDRVPHISEQVYNQLYPERPAFDPPYFLTNELIALRPVVVYCRLPSVTAMMNSMEFKLKAHKPQDHIDRVLANYPRLVETYDHLIAELQPHLTLFRYAWDCNSYPTLLENLKCAASS